MKFQILSFFLLFVVASFAQDLIIKTDNEEIKVRIVEIKEDGIDYIGLNSNG